MDQELAADRLAEASGRVLDALREGGRPTPTEKDALETALLPYRGYKICGHRHMVYWMHGLCVHESVPQYKTVPRQFVRLSLPSRAPWFEGYTENPYGVMPTGPILPRREFMNL